MKTHIRADNSVPGGILTRPGGMRGAAKFQALADASPGAAQLQALQQMAGASPQSRNAAQWQTWAAQGPVAQLAKIKSNFGTWETKQYAPKVNRDMVGADIALEFMPNFRCPDKDRIGLIQTVKNIYAGRIDTIEGLHREVALTAEDSAEHAGVGIDRSDDFGADPTANNPVYGSVPRSDNPVAATGLYDLKNTPDKTDGNQLGFYNASGSMSVSAKLSDSPRLDKSGDTRQTFETAAMILTGQRQGEFLGSVSWGYRARREDVQLEDFALVSEGTPSASYILAAKKWNESGKKAGKGSGGGSDLIKIPLPPENDSA